MTSPPAVVVADSSPLITLGRLGLLDQLLPMLGDVVIPSQVRLEAVGDTTRPGAAAILQALARGSLRELTVHDHELRPFLVHVDEGEAAAIALGLRLGSDHLLMDDAAGRRLAVKVGLQVMGVIGVLVAARRQQRVTDPADLVARLEAVQFRLSPALKAMLLLEP